MEEKLISVIVPIYNVEKYVEKCIESLLTHTKAFSNAVEILLIDDGSTDSCPTICDAFAKENKQIKAFHKNNGGLSDARNFGIQHAKGKFLCFVDGDDFVSKEFADILNILQQADADVFFTNINIVKCDKTKIVQNHKLSGIVNAQSNLKKIVLPTTRINSACDKIIKRSFLLDNNLFFKQGIAYEDFEWSNRMYLKLKTCYFTNICFYNYIVLRPGSIMNSAKTKHFFDYITSGAEFLQSEDFLLLSKKTQKLFKQHITFCTLSVLRKTKTLTKEEKTEVFAYLKKHKEVIASPSTLASRMLLLFGKILGLQNTYALISKLF